jgi:hypothetical protein
VSCLSSTSSFQHFGNWEYKGQQRGTLDQWNLEKIGAVIYLKDESCRSVVRGYFMISTTRKRSGHLCKTRSHETQNAEISIAIDLREI